MDVEEAYDILREIDSKVIGFGGGWVVLLLFILINRKYISLGAFVFLGLAIYVISLGTGILVDGMVKDSTGAFIAGFWAPVFYCTLATIWLRYHYEPPKEEKSDIDHLIH